MTRGIGTDIIEIERIEKVISRYGQKFLDRIFTKKEQDYCLTHRKSTQHFAGRFAAKEAVVKALGTGLGKISWTDIEIDKDEQGKPIVIFSNKINEIFSDPSVLLSISHSIKYATAVAIYL